MEVRYREDIVSEFLVRDCSLPQWRFGFSLGLFFYRLTKIVDEAKWMTLLTLEVEALLLRHRWHDVWWRHEDCAVAVEVVGLCARNVAD